LHFAMICELPSRYLSSKRDESGGKRRPSAVTREEPDGLKRTPEVFAEADQASVSPNASNPSLDPPENPYITNLPSGIFCPTSNCHKPPQLMPP
jgi:hypothetical protein